MKFLRETLRHQAQALTSGIPLSTYRSNQLINQCSKNGLLQHARKLFDRMPERNVFTWNSIISAYIKAQNLEEAKTLFAKSPWKDIVTYNSMLTGYVVTDGCEGDAVRLFIDMRCDSGSVKADEFTMTTMSNLSAKLCELSFGRQLHSLMVRSGCDVSVFAVCSLIDMYSKCGCFLDAKMVFDGGGKGMDLVAVNAMVAACCRAGEMDLALKLFGREPELNDTVSWNTVISGFVQNGFEVDALRLSVRMIECGFRWNEHTFAGVLSACCGSKCLRLGKVVHARVLIENAIINPYISSGIVDVYCKCDDMKNAELAFSCLGGGIGNGYAVTSMIIGHSSQGNMVEARRLFDLLNVKDFAVWKALFSGYLKSEQYGFLFELLYEFTEKEGTAPDSSILITVLGACADRALIDPGKQLHAYILRMYIKADKMLQSAMIDMYSKCGSITYAENIFQGTCDRDTILFNIMIAGYAHHGRESQAIQLFEQMLDCDMRPDAATFIAVLSACRHCGLVELGEKYFESMTKDFNIEAEIDHYTCMIDLYGRGRQLYKVVAFMKSIPKKPDAAIWGAFLQACKLNKNAELALEAEEELLLTDPGNGARYVQLANIYAAERKWSEMGRLRKEMRAKQVVKHAGCSWLHFGNKAHIFISGDKPYMRTEDMSCTLACLTAEINDRRKMLADFQLL